METDPESRILFGTCAWSFDDWRGRFYPKDLPQSHWLEHYSSYLPAVEVDSTFYHVPALYVIENWLQRTPSHFVFTCKMPKAITHEARLRDCAGDLEIFLEGIAPLGARLGCILIQLPPSFHIEHDEMAFKEFVMALPPGFRFAVEFRHPGWHTPRVAHFLEENRIAWVWNDVSALDEQNRAPFAFLPQTTDFLYIRLLGDLNTKYHQDGSRLHRYGRLMWPREPALESWAVKIEKHLAECARIFVFANNHFEGFSPLSCKRLAKRLGIELTLPEPEPEHHPADPQLELL